MIEQVEGDILKRVTFEAGFDCHNLPCKHAPQGKHGVHGAQIRFILRGPKGATHFLLYTGWVLPQTLGLSGEPDWRTAWSIQYADRLRERTSSLMPADLGYHAYGPRYEGQHYIKGCDVLTDAEGCYTDGSGLNAERPFARLLQEGDEGVWAELWDYYRSTFDVKQETAAGSTSSGRTE